MNRKNIGFLIGFLIVFSMALTPTILLINQKPTIIYETETTIERYYNETVIERYYYNETIIINNTIIEPEPEPEPEPIIERGRAPLTYNLNFFGIYDYHVFNYTMGRNEIYYYDLENQGFTFGIDAVPDYLYDTFISTDFTVFDNWQISFGGSAGGSWRPPFLANWSIVIWWFHPTANKWIDYYDAIETL